MTFLWWSWRILSNLAILLVVITVLFGLKNGLERLVVPILGMIYVTIRAIGAGLALMLLKVTLSQQAQLDQIHMLLDGAYYPEREEDRESVKKLEKRWMVDGIFLALISFSCIIAFFANN